MQDAAHRYAQRQDAAYGAVMDDDWADEPTIDDVRNEFPGWVLHRGISGLFYASMGSASLAGEDAWDLRDQIIRWKRLNEDY